MEIVRGDSACVDLYSYSILTKMNQQLTDILKTFQTNLQELKGLVEVAKALALTFRLEVIQNERLFLEDPLSSNIYQKIRAVYILTDRKFVGILPSIDSNMATQNRQGAEIEEFLRKSKNAGIEINILFSFHTHEVQNEHYMEHPGLNYDDIRRYERERRDNPWKNRRPYSTDPNQLLLEIIFLLVASYGVIKITEMIIKRFEEAKGKSLYSQLESTNGAVLVTIKKNLVI